MTTIIPLEAAACLLPEPEQAERRQQVIRTLVQAVRQTRELPDGYGLAFPGEADWLARLAEFVAFERNCCPAFRFEIICEPGHGPLWLHVRGEGGVKEMIRAELEAVAGFMDVRVTPKDDTLNNLAASVPAGMPFSALITARKP